jgi:hypothetical protein
LLSARVYTLFHPPAPPNYTFCSPSIPNWSKLHFYSNPFRTCSYHPFLLASLPPQGCHLASTSTLLYSLRSDSLAALNHLNKPEARSLHSLFYSADASNILAPLRQLNKPMLCSLVRWCPNRCYSGLIPSNHSRTFVSGFNLEDSLTCLPLRLTTSTDN